MWYFVFFFSSRRRHTRCSRDWSSDVCSSDLCIPTHGGNRRRREDGELCRRSARGRRLRVDATDGHTACPAAAAKVNTLSRSPRSSRGAPQASCAVGGCVGGGLVPGSQAAGEPFEYCVQDAGGDERPLLSYLSDPDSLSRQAAMVEVIAQRGEASPKSSLRPTCVVLLVAQQ